MTEKMQARRVQNPKNGLCAVLPKIYQSGDCVEYVVTLGVIITLLYIAGASNDILLGVLMFMLTLCLAGIALFFAVFTVILISAKKQEGCFAGFECIGPKMVCAVYMSDGVKYTNVFPRENFFAKRLYIKDKPVKLRLTRVGLYAIDPNAFHTIIAGDIAAAAIWIVYSPAAAEFFADFPTLFI